MSIPLPPFSIVPDAEDAQAAIEALRAEIEVAGDERQRSFLLYEAGVFEQRASSDAQAVRDLLASVNAAPDFLEPLERLVSIIDRRRSYKNLDKLLERLCKVADGPDEVARAELIRSAFLADHVEDLARAQQAAEEAIRAKPNDSAGWLALELLAARQGDETLRRTALAARAEIAEDPEWKALLLIDVAAAAAADDFAAALAAAERAVSIKGPATFAAVEAMAELGRMGGRDDVLARALEARGALIKRSVEAAEAGDALGVPTTRRDLAYAADAWLRASEAHRRRGDIPAATKLLERARAELPDEAVLTRGALRLAEARGDTEAAAALARAELERGVRGGLAASLWLKVAESAAAGGDAGHALDALSRALAADPESVPARALQLDLLMASGDAQGLAGALAAAQEVVQTPGARARLAFARAEILATDARDLPAARAALEEAAAVCPEQAALAFRVARALAAVGGAPDVYVEATRRLLDCCEPGSPEALGLAADLARLAATTEPAGVEWESALGGLSRHGQVGARLAATLTAFGPTDAATPRHVALGHLADGSAPPLSRALKLLASVAARAAGDETAAVELLRSALDDAPEDLTASSALASALGRGGDPSGSARVLGDCARVVDDPDLALVLTLEAGLVGWAADSRAAAVQSFEKAAELAPDSTGPLLSWALGAVAPDDLDARRRALDASGETGDAVIAALDDLGLCLARDESAGRALETLSRAAEEAGPPFGILADLACAVAAAEPEARRGALLALSQRGGEGAALTAAAAHAAALEDPDRPSLLPTARAWAQAARSPEAALEWLGAATAADAAGDRDEALRALAGTLAADAGSAVASLVELDRFLKGESARLIDRPELPARLMDLETSPPGADPTRRAYALSMAAEALGDEAFPEAHALIGYNCLAAGLPARALVEFRAYTDAFPSDEAGWEGLREAAELAGEPRDLARACAALAEGADDATRAAELWEQAGLVLLEAGSEQDGEAALERAVASDIHRFSSFDKLFRRVRSRKDGPALLTLIERRLEVTEDAEEIAKLYWERARVLRQSGDAKGALEAIDNVVMLEPDHVGALALSGEIFITEQRFEEAAQYLARLSTLEEAPAQQRLMSGVAAADLYENKLGDVASSVDVLVKLDGAGLSTPAVRERLARAAAKNESWEHAAAALGRLARERDTRAGRVDAARLAMAIHRDRLETPGKAHNVVGQLLSEIPDDGEALDLVLEGVFDREQSRQWLEEGKRATLRALVASPGDAERALRLAEIARVLEDVALCQTALGIIKAIGADDDRTDRELSELEARIAKVPRMALDDAVLAEIRDRADAGPIAELFKVMAPTFAEALGPGLAALEVSRRDRVRDKDDSPLRGEVAAWAGAMGIGEFEFYQGGRDPDGIYGVPTEVPAIVAGARITSPLSAGHRAALARELFALRVGTSLVRHRDPSEVAAVVAAACSIGGAEGAGPAYAMFSEFQRRIAKEIPRKVKKLLPDLARAVVSAEQDPIEWAAGAESSLDRMASIAAGDVSWALISASAERGKILSTEDGRQRMSRLLSFVLSPKYGEIRSRLGLGVR